MSGHTPGPWSVPHFAQPDVNCNCEYVLTDHLMGAVCAVYASGDGDDWQKHGDNPRFTEAVANAHLIAAAPDLRAALILCAMGLNQIHDRKLTTDEQIALDAARAALDKAEGQK